MTIGDITVLAVLIGTLIALAVICWPTDDKASRYEVAELRSRITRLELDNIRLRCELERKKDKKK